MSPEHDGRLVHLEHGRAHVARAIGALMRAAYAVEGRRIGRDDFSPARRGDEEIRSAGTTFLGWSSAGELRAVAEVERGEDEVALDGFTVRVADQGRGVGRAFLAALLDDLAAPRVHVSTARANEPALRLYRGAGFRETKSWSTDCGIPMCTLTREARR